ncbi:hypothetical protein GOP47_0006706 [Adiantum capillus-veneris]|uniref:Uncharacterized protein n=1 Tax=Adiantum capillus-veneris TaxID=13818 RepID=A0A9D4V3E1_ADICA|nr:hypothetical protein GOP47_0006706 [Adiantum capillus-veneris]
MRTAVRFITIAAESPDDLSFNGDLHSNFSAPDSTYHDPCSSSLSREGDHFKLIKTRSYSCSKLQCRIMTMPSLNSLLHRNRCHGQLHGARTSSSRLMQYEHVDTEELEAAGSKSTAACLSECTRSWSSPSLGRMKKPSSSFNGDLDQAGKVGGNSKKGKGTPKGHVAVYVAGENERHVVPISYLSHPKFQERVWVCPKGGSAAALLTS